MSNKEYFQLTTAIIITDNEYLFLGLCCLLPTLHPRQKINVIRVCDYNYKKTLKEITKELSLENVVIFCENSLYKAIVFFINNQKNSQCQVVNAIELFSSIPGRVGKIPFNGEKECLSFNLTAMEYCICTLTKKHLSDKKMSKVLDLSIKTVSAHRRRIMEKMHFKKKQEFYLFCFEL
ncbi:hypothetical protein JBO38_21485 [Enterobacter asburiae]|uniref:helix-turn-helix transcriptional regulator n=1 Tax=Enterobacter asburiae TaxID=61645 RepID=UPI00192AA08D|nr:LuxR C-terminal-related transcriptional regulator [Enterobacter asburiae]MBL5950318.1 hypothetical protein [Enterobacter asburiae]